MEDYSSNVDVLTQRSIGTSSEEISTPNLAVVGGNAGHFTVTLNRVVVDCKFGTELPLPWRSCKSLSGSPSESPIASIV